MNFKKKDWVILKGLKIHNNENLPSHCVNVYDLYHQMHASLFQTYKTSTHQPETISSSIKSCPILEIDFHCDCHHLQPRRVYEDLETRK